MNQLLEWIDNYKKTNPTGWRKWLVGIFVLLGSILVITVWVLTASMRGSQIAGLEAQRDAAEEAVRQAETNQQLATDAQTQAEHAALASEARQRAVEIAQQLQTVQEQHARNTQIIQGLGSWADVDSKVK